MILAQPAQILGQSAYAEFARLAAAGGQGGPVRRALVRCVTIAFAAALPVLILVALFGRRLIVLLAGKAFAEAAPVMLWLAVARVLLLASPAISAALRAIGRPGLSMLANIVTSLGLLIVLPPMLTEFGLIGSGIFSLLQAVVAVAMLSWFMHRETAEGRLPRSPA